MKFGTEILWLKRIHVTFILSDSEKYAVLTNAWQPDSNYKFPASGNRNLKFQHSWLQSFPWLTYSPSEDGVYCRYCFLFAPEHVGARASQLTCSLVQNSFRQWKKAIEKFEEHQLKQFHLHAKEAAQDFIDIHSGKRLDIACEIEQGRLKQKQANRIKLILIAEAIILVGRQGLSLRGHRDDGPLNLDLPIENDGNFRAILRFAIQQGNKILEEHITNGPANATYVSHRIQNEMIKAAMQEKIRSIGKLFLKSV